MNLLFINDGSFYSGLVCELLCFNGYTVYEETYTANLHNVLQKKQVDIVLCYVPLAAVRSLALLTELRTSERSRPLLAITTYPVGSEVRQHIQALTPFCLTIPFAAEMLFQMITQATGIKKRTVSFRASGPSLHQHLVRGVG
jgi:DNA-binding NtrC family response regulator